MSILKAKTNKAVEAIREVHADKSGSLQDNLDALEQLEAELQELIQAIEDDINMTN